MSKSDELIATVEQIHAAGLGTQTWPQALDAIARVVGGNAASIEVVDQQTKRHREMYSHGLPGAEEIAFLPEFPELNIRFPFVARQKLNEMSWDYLILDESAMRRAPFYTEIMPRFDIRYFVAGVVLKTVHEFASIAVHRSPRMGHIQRDGIALMRQLLPHVGQAFDVARRLKGAGEARYSLERALDWLADGVSLVRADGAVVYANEAFQAIARRNDGIGIRRGRVEFTAGSARAGFDEAVGAAARLHAGETQRFGADFHVRRGPDAPPYLVSVRPLLDKKHAGKGAVAIVFVHDPLVRSVAALRMLREILGLTEAEAALAQAVQSGMSLADYAKADAISLNTVYTHLRRIKEKTGCHRMAELIRKLNDLQVPLRVV